MKIITHTNGVVEIVDASEREFERLTSGGVTRCGYCGRMWDDSVWSALTPAPAGRCPFEYEHDEPCDTCDDDGILWSGNPETVVAVERCDTCEQYEDDIDAAFALNRVYPRLQALAYVTVKGDVFKTMTYETVAEFPTIGYEQEVHLATPECAEALLAELAEDARRYEEGQDFEDYTDTPDDYEGDRYFGGEASQDGETEVRL